jgi:hypothetical protein
VLQIISNLVVKTTYVCIVVSPYPNILFVWL